MSAAERRARALVRRMPEGPVEGAEVGVHDGRMSAWLLRLCPDLTLHMVDNWLPAGKQAATYRATGDPRSRLTEDAQERAMHHARLATSFAAGRRSLWRLDSADAARRFPPGSLDFVFLDADHSYAALRLDLAAWEPAIRPGGLLCGHDYGSRSYPGVRRAVDELAAERSWDVKLGENETWFVRL